MTLTPDPKTTALVPIDLQRGIAAGATQPHAAESDVGVQSTALDALR